jgi:WD40 repeat protein
LKDEVPGLWNFELTECIRPIATLKGDEKPIRLSDELIACESHCRTLTPEELSDSGYPSEKEDSIERFQMLVVDIVNVTSGECVSSIKTRVCSDEDVRFISCNSQNQLLVCTTKETVEGSIVVEHFTVSLRNNNLLKRAWERTEKRIEGSTLGPCFIFSPEEQFVATWNSFDSGYGVHILDAQTGETRHTFLEDQNDIVDCKFVVNGESLVCCSEDNFLRLFNIRSGDLLSVLDIEEKPHCLGASLGKPLVAIRLRGARLKFVHVKLPSVQDAEGKKGENWLHVNCYE